MKNIHLISITLLLVACKPQLAPTNNVQVAQESAITNRKVNTQDATQAFNQNKNIIFMSSYTQPDGHTFSPYEAAKLTRDAPDRDSGKLIEITTDAIRLSDKQPIIGDLDNDGWPDALVNYYIDPYDGMMTFGFYAIFRGGESGLKFVANMPSGFSQYNNSSTEIKTIKNGVVHGIYFAQDGSEQPVQYVLHKNSLVEIPVPIEISQPLAINGYIEVDEPTEELTTKRANAIFGKIFAKSDITLSACIGRFDDRPAAMQIYKNAKVEVSGNEAELDTMLGIPKQFTMKFGLINITAGTTLTPLLQELKKSKKFDFSNTHSGKLEKLNLFPDDEEENEELSYNIKEKLASANYTNELFIRPLDRDGYWFLYFLDERLVAIQSRLPC